MHEDAGLTLPLHSETRRHKLPARRLSHIKEEHTKAQKRHVSQLFKEMV